MNDPIEMRLETIEEEIKQIKERNRRVEVDKAWETSRTRKILIAVLTYFAIVLFMHYSEIAQPFLAAIIPAAGFVISTLSLSFFKALWQKHSLK